MITAVEVARTFYEAFRKAENARRRAASEKAGKWRHATLIPDWEKQTVRIRDHYVAAAEKVVALIQREEPPCLTTTGHSIPGSESQAPSSTPPT